MIQILISDTSYDNDTITRSEVEAGIRQEFEAIGWEVRLEQESVPEAADWPVILASIGGIFLLGKPIRDNLDAWIDLASRFKKLVVQISMRFGALRLDSTGCGLLALDEIVNFYQGNLYSIAEVGELEFRAREYELRDPRLLVHHPDTVLIRLYLVNDETLVVAIVKSSGIVTLLHREALSLYEF